MARRRSTPSAVVTLEAPARRPGAPRRLADPVRRAGAALRRVLASLSKPSFAIAEDAPRRWVDANKVGALLGYPVVDEEGNRGLTIDEETIDLLVENFYRHDDLVPCDGAGVSPVHGLVDDSGLPAAAWIHNAEKRLDGDGVAHLWLELELPETVAAAMDGGQLAYGSIAFDPNAVDRNTGELIGPDLHSYAITNKPFRDGLTPAAAVGTLSLSASRIGKVEKVALGPAAELKAQLVSMLRISPEPGEELDAWELQDRIRKILDAADIEQILEGGMPGTNQVPPPAAPMTNGATMATKRTKNTAAPRKSARPDQTSVALAHMARLGLDESQIDLLLRQAGEDPAKFDSIAAKMQALLGKLGGTPAPAAETETPAPAPAAPAPGPGGGAETPATLAEGETAITPEQATMLVSGFVESMRAVSGDPAMTPEAALALLQSNQDTFAGAMTTPAGAGGDQMSDATLAEMKAQIAALEAQNKKLSARVNAREESAIGTDIGAIVDDALAVRELEVDDAAREDFCEVVRAFSEKDKDGQIVSLEKGKAKLASILKTTHVPPVRANAFGSPTRTRASAGGDLEERRVRIEKEAAEKGKTLTPYQAAKLAAAEAAREGRVVGL